MGAVEGRGAYRSRRDAGNDSKPRRIERHRRVVTGGDVGVLEGGGGGIGAWNIYPLALCRI